jgi:hypothetical protein
MVHRGGHFREVGPGGAPAWVCAAAGGRSGWCPRPGLRLCGAHPFTLDERPHRPGGAALAGGRPTGRGLAANSTSPHLGRGWIVNRAAGLTRQKATRRERSVPSGDRKSRLNDALDERGTIGLEPVPQGGASTGPHTVGSGDPLSRPAAGEARGARGRSGWEGRQATRSPSPQHRPRPEQAHLEPGDRLGNSGCR